MSKDSVSIKVGEIITVTADKKVTWKSSDENIVGIDENGKIVGIKLGSAVIVATDENDKKSYITVIVYKSESSGTEDNSNTGASNSSNQGSNSESGNNSNKGSNSSNSSSKSPSTQNQQSSSSANDVVPATGESSVGTIIILAIVTLIVASVIFKHKIKVK